MTRTLEELEMRLEAAAPDTPEAVDAMIDIAWEIWTNDFDRSSTLTHAAHEVAERIGYQRGLMYAKRGIGLVSYSRGEIEDALTFLLEAHEWFRNSDDRRGDTQAKAALSYVYWGLGDFKRGFQFAEDALQMSESLPDKNEQGWALSALGNFYHDWNDHHRSLDYYEKAYDIFVDIGNKSGQARTLNGIGNTHFLLGEHETALEYQSRALTIQSAIDHEFGAAKTLNDIGIILQGMARWDEALAYHRRALDLRERRKYAQGQCTCLLDIGTVLIELRQYDEAEKVLNKALFVADKIKSKPKMSRAHELITRLNKDLGKFDVALVHYENFHRITADVYSEDAQQKLKNLKTAHEVEAALRENEIYRLKNVELHDKNELLQQTLDELHGTQAQLLQDGKMVALGNLVAGLAHEINTPVGAIKSASDTTRRAVERLQKAVHAGRDASEITSLVDVLGVTSKTTATGADRIAQLVRSLRAFTRIDEAPFQKADIHEGIESTLTLLAAEIPATINIVKAYGKVLPIYCYPSELNQVFMNLIMNAVQAVGQEGTVRIETSASPGRVSVVITDTGKGIPPEKIERLFEPGFTRKHERVRMRTGLYTSYNIVKNHMGELTVSSEAGKGTTFNINLPDNLDRILSAGSAPSASSPAA